MEELKNVKSGKGYLVKLFAIAEENRKLSLTIFGLIVLVVYLGMALVKIKEEMILSVDIPEKVYYTGEVHIGKDKANELFYKLWGAYLVKDIIGNYSHKDIKQKYTYLMENLSAEKVSKYGPTIKDKVKKTITQLITHTYKEGKVITRGDEYNFTYISYGRGKKKIGEIEEIDEACEVQLDMSVSDFKMKIDRIYAKCTREGKKK